MYYKSVVCIRPVFSRVDKKRGTYRVKESVHLNRPTVEPNRIRKHNGRRVSVNGENGDQPSGSEWAVRRNSAQVLQLGKLSPLHCQCVVDLLEMIVCYDRLLVSNINFQSTLLQSL